MNSILRVDCTPEAMTALLNFAESTFREAWQAMNDPKDFELYCQNAFSMEKFQEEFAADNAEFYRVEQDEKIIAYLKLNLHTAPTTWAESGGALQIERIYVLPSIQSKGLGQQLMHFAEQRAKDTHTAWVWLSVWKAAPRSIAFYEKNGYTIFGEEVFMVGTDPQMDWLMRKKLID